MEVTILKNYEELSLATAEKVVEIVKDQPEALLCFAAGSTPLKTFDILVDYASKGIVDFSQCTFVGLDEWVGMGKGDQGSCYETLNKWFFQPLQIQDETICFFDTEAVDLEAECKQVDEFIFQNGKINLMLLGIGVNGHLGLNEPGVSFDLYSHVITLSEKTREVGQKYFEQKKVLTEGITLGPRHIMDSTTVMVMANGSHKAAAVHQMLEGDVTTQLPASILQTHPDCYVFLDESAANMLK